MIAIYERISHDSQELASQHTELERWANNQSEPVEWYSDTATGTKMDRPQMNRLMADVATGKITKVVTWRLDRLGRTASGLLQFFEYLKNAGCGFLALRDCIDLSTPSGRLLVVVLAGVAQFETEVRSERQRAGIARVRAKNGGRCPWGGRKVGTRVKVTEAKERSIHALHKSGMPIQQIAHSTGVTRQTVYKTLGLWTRN